MRQSGGTQARVRMVALQPFVELLDLAFQLGNFVVEHPGPFGNRVCVFSKPCHDGGVQRQRPNRDTSSAAKASVAMPASGQVSAKPRRQSSPNVCFAKRDWAGVPATGVAASPSWAAPDRTGNFSLAAFHSIRAFSSVVKARVSSMLKLSWVQVSSWNPSTLER